MPTVLQVLPALQSGGVERGTVEIAQAISQSGETAHVASQGGQMVGAVIRAGASHHTLPLASKNPLVILRNAVRLARLIRNEKIDIVHARSRAPAWSAWLAARNTGAHFMTTYHAVYNENLPGKHRYNAIMARGERVIAISHHIARHVIETHRIDPAIVRVIHRGVDAALFDPAGVSGQRIAALAAQWRVPEDQMIILLPGRLSRWKGHAVLIDALARLARPDVCAVLVGPDRGRDRLSHALVTQAERLGIAAHVRLVGECPDMPAAYALADIVVNPSIEPEGFGRTVIEAQAMERLVLASNHGGAVETIEHGVTGWRVAPGDAAALANALAYALSLSPDERRTIGQRARHAVLTQFTTASMQQATLDVYAELMTDARA
jgi:glycosyltransferase involved in cell wall biosynthesis